MDDQEFEIGHRCISAPIYDYRGDIIAAISASGDVRVLTDDRIEDTAEYVRQAALETGAAAPDRELPAAPLDPSLAGGK